MRKMLYSKYINRPYVLPNEQVYFYFRDWVPRWLAFLVARFVIFSTYQRIVMGVEAREHERP